MKILNIIKRQFAFLALTALLVVTSFCASCGEAAKPDAIVAADGSGQFKTVQEAINALPQTTSSTNPWIILVKPGICKEIVYIQREKRFVHLIGEDAAKTVITYDLNATIIGQDSKPIGTFRTPTVLIDADNFTVENITFENSAGPVGQALAVRIDGDRIVFRSCKFLGWQDTVFVNRGRHYFENCYIAGHVDFIFSGATVWFEKCHIHCLREGYITAASTPDNQPFSYVFPNPFNPTTTICYTLNSNVNVELSIYNPLGQKIKTLVNESQSAGEHAVIFKAVGLSSGIYFYQLNTGKQVVIKKVVLLH